MRKKEVDYSLDEEAGEKKERDNEKGRECVLVYRVVDKYECVGCHARFVVDVHREGEVGRTGGWNTSIKKTKKVN